MVWTLWLAWFVTAIVCVGLLTEDRAVTGHVRSLLWVLPITLGVLTWAVARIHLERQRRPPSS